MLLPGYETPSGHGTVPTAQSPPQRAASGTQPHWGHKWRVASSPHKWRVASSPHVRETSRRGTHPHMGRPVALGALGCQRPELHSRSAARSANTLKAKEGC
jgi:hypothetical protein